MSESESEPYSEIIPIATHVFQNIAWDEIVRVLFLFFLLVTSAIISGSKLSFYLLTPENRIYLFNRKPKKNARFSKLFENPSLYNASLLIAGIFTDIAITLIWLQVFDVFFYLPDLTNGESIVLKLGIIISVLVVFCELFPRLLAVKSPLTVSVFFIGPIRPISQIFLPLAKLYIQFNQFAEKVFNKRNGFSLSDMTEAIENSGKTSTEDKKLLEGIASYGSIYVVEIMRPRVDVMASEISLSFEQLLEKITTHKHSRIPIYQETFDNIKGILYVKDLLPHYHKKTFNWQTLIRPAYFIPESKKINDLLADFQQKKIHMAIVTDEYGGTSGIITLEDVLEEIVGEIVYEIDPNDEYFRKIDEKTYLFEGKISLNDFFKIIEIEDDYFADVQGDADTLAGVILEMHGEILKAGAVFTYKEYEFSIVSSDKRRIKQIKVRKTIN
jgi:putative hemolysin